MNPTRRIPVVLLTGALGSGKTTLLSAWLRQPALRDAALVVNEIGEIGLDDRLLLPMMQAAEGAALVANACVCCTGLPGLEQAMADLFRARLERRIARFESLVIETTGLAEPQPVRAALAGDLLLRERYALLGVVTTVSATTPEALRERAEWQAQVRGADLLVITKADRGDAAALDALERRLRSLNPHAAIARSANASFPADEAMRLLAQRQGGDPEPAAAPTPTPSRAQHDHRHAHHHHDAAALFVPLPQAWPRSLLAQRLQRALAADGGQLLRVKGIVMTEDGAAVAVQWAAGDEEAVLAPFDGDVPAPGLTVIAASRDAAEAFARRLAR